MRQVGLALAEQGWKVDMFTRRSSREQAAIVQHSANCRTIRLQAGAAEFLGRDELFGYLPEYVRAFQAFQQQHGFRYSLVHTNYWLSAWVGMRLKQLQSVSQIHTYHSLGAVKYRNIEEIPAIASKRLAVEKACLETAERIVATSPQEQEHMRSLVSTKGQIDIIPCGTDIDRFGAIERAAARQQLGIAPDEKVVLYVGRFDKRKGIETLVRSVARLHAAGQTNLKLIIGGGSHPDRCDGRERDRIELIVKELGLDAITVFPGRLNDRTLPIYYAAADVSVVPSHYEPFGLVAIEAMASRIPVVASDVGGLQFTVVSEETGLLAPAKDDAAFAQAINRILADPSWARQLGERGRQRVETHFSWQGVAIELGHLYTRAIALQKIDRSAIAA